MNRPTFPLHPAQWDVYTDQLLNVESPHYNIGGYISIIGPLNTERFREAVNSVPAVFDVFKMRFDIDLPGSGYIDENYDEMEMADLDLSDHPEPERLAIDWMKTRFNTPFVIKKGNLLFEQVLIKISSDKYWYFAKYHHLIIDGYGFIVLAQYLAKKYQSLISGDEVKFTYPTYLAEIQKALEYHKAEHYQSDAEYWKDKFDKKPEKMLHRRFPVEKTSVKNSSSYTLSLDEAERKLLEELQATTKSGLQQLTIAALLIYYGKILPFSEFTFGVPIHKRGSRQLRNTIGMFAGVLPFKGKFQKDAKLGDFLTEIIQTQKKDYRHQHYLIGDLSRDLKLNASEGYLFEISINHELFNFSLDFGNILDASIFHLSTSHEVTPLQICWQDYGQQQPLQLHLHFRHDYFSNEEIELFAERIIYILKQFPAALSKNIGSIDILPAQELNLFAKFNHTTVEFQRDKTIVELLYQQAGQTPDRKALIFKDEQLTYDNLNVRSNQLAHYLRAKGVKEKTLVLICIDRSIDMFIGILGILKSGGAYVPIDPDYPVDRIRYIIEDSRSAIVVCNSSSKSKLPSQDNLTIIELDKDSQLIEKMPEENLNVSIKQDQLVYVIYTSGSTGNPKGVMIEHGNLLSYIMNEQAKYINDKGLDSGTYMHLSYTFDASVTAIFLPLVFGKCVVISSKESLEVFEDQNFKKNAPYDFIKLTPSHVALLEAGIYDNSGKLITQKLVVGGEALHLSHLDYLIAKGMDVEIINEYGPTEATVGCSTFGFRTSDDLNQFKNGIPIGKPIDNVQLYILNDEHELLPIGIPGEIYIGGNGLARGYLNRPDLTEIKFIANPFDKNNRTRLYRTGDLGRYLVNGNIEYLGRLDDQIKIRGYRVELGEIETVLEQSELVAKAVVLVRDDKSLNKRLIAYIRPTGSFNLHAIKAYLKERIPHYMVPDLWVEIMDFPLTSNGKIDKKALPDPDFKSVLSNNYVAPRNKLEAELVEIWKEVLGLETIGIYDNFFELGGHSLKAMQLISRLHMRLNIQTNIAKILTNPTIDQLADVLALNKSPLYSEIVKVTEQENYELSHAQKRIFVISYFKDGSTIYNAPGAYLIKGELQVPAFKAAFKMIIERHENLRTIFVQVDNEPRQKILSSSEVKFEIQEVDLRDKENSEELIEKWMEDDSRQAFDLEKAPLWRATLFHTGPEQFIITFNIHHIISDGWSKSILINELLQLYKHLTTGTGIKLPKLSIQYKDYAAWHSASYATQQTYWTELYGKDVPVLSFPTDFERPKILSFSGKMIHRHVSNSITLRLRKLAVHHGTTLNNLLFALYGVLIAKHSRQNDVVVGSLVSGRSHIDVENMVGVFINFLPLRLSPKSELTLKEYLQNSYKVLADAYSNQDYPFDLMVDNIIRKRDFSRNPFFDTMVNFHSENNIQLKEDSIADTGLEIIPLDLLKKDFFQSVLDFKLDIELTADSMVLNISYNENLFLKERMEDLLTEYIELLSMAVEDTEIYLDQYFNWTEPKADPSTNESTASTLSTSMLPLNICASFVAEPLQEYMEYWSNEFELNTKPTFAPYNQVFQQLLDPDSILNKNKGINLLFIRIEDWLRDKRDNSVPKLLYALDQTYSEFIEAIEYAHQSNFVPFLIGIVPLQPSHSFPDEVANHIDKLNHKLELFLHKLPRFRLLDLKKIASLYTVEEVFDAKSDQLGHIPFTQEYYAALGTFIMRKVRAYKGHPYKVLVLDCDNTLWKGVCGEAGATNVTIDENFSYLQNFLVGKYNEGFLLALCSKNNEKDVWEVFDQHPQMKLKREHISAHQINWNPKPGNLVAIANELNLSTNSLVFIDDSQFEIEQTTLACPDVLSLTLPEDEPGSFPDFLDHIWQLDHFQITEEDAKRNIMYKAEKERKQELIRHSSLEDFIHSLNIEVNIHPIEEKNLERAVQLTLRTNQFNLNGIRKSSEEIAKFIHQKNRLNWIIEVNDRFGDYGFAGLLIGRESGNALVLETFLLSCRVLGRNVEEVILEELRSYCMMRGLGMLSLEFRPTTKNQPFIQFLNNYKWESDEETNTYSLPIKNAEPKLLVK